MPPPPPPPRAARARHALRNLPTQLTLLRLLGIPVIWGLALWGTPRMVAVGIVVAGLTDVLDGPIARWTRTTSRFGSALDTVADLALATCTALWLALLRTDFVRAHLGVLVAWAVCGIAVLAVGWLRFRRIGDLHLLSAKAAGPVAYLWAVCLLFDPACDVRLFYAAVALAFLAQAEMLWAFVTRDRVDEPGVGSGSALPRLWRLLRSPRRPRSGGGGARDSA